MELVKVDRARPCVSLCRTLQILDIVVVAFSFFDVLVEFTFDDDEKSGISGNVAVVRLMRMVRVVFNLDSWKS